MYVLKSFERFSLIQVSREWTKCVTQMSYSFFPLEGNVYVCLFAYQRSFVSNAYSILMFSMEGVPPSIQKKKNIGMAQGKMSHIWEKLKLILNSRKPARAKPHRGKQRTLRFLQKVWLFLLWLDLAFESCSLIDWIWSEGAIVISVSFSINSDVCRRPLYKVQKQFTPVMLRNRSLIPSAWTVTKHWRSTSFNFILSTSLNKYKCQPVTLESLMFWIYYWYKCSECI